MHKILAVGLLSAGVLGAAVPSWATDVHTRAIVATCMSCHGTDGKAKGAMPPINGRDKAYFVTQMKDFKSGKRPGSVMNKHAAGYTDEEFEKMAEYFGGIK